MASRGGALGSRPCSLLRSSRRAEWLTRRIFWSAKPRSRVPSLRSWTRSWRPSLGVPSIPSRTAGRILRHVSRTPLPRAKRMLLPSWNQQAMLATRRHVTPSSCATTNTSCRRPSRRPQRNSSRTLTVPFSPRPSSKRSLSRTPRRSLWRVSTRPRPRAQDDIPAQWDVADVLREAEPRAEQLLVDEYLVAVPEQSPVQEPRSSHYPVLPAPEPEREAIGETDAALRRIRERLNDPDESRARKSRLRRRHT